jgi:hypothetical protein
MKCEESADNSVALMNSTAAMFDIFNDRAM